MYDTWKNSVETLLWTSRKQLPPRSAVRRLIVMNEAIRRGKLTIES